MDLDLLPGAYTARERRVVTGRAGLRALPVRQREALVLRYWGDLSVEQCATAMGVSVGAVNQHLHRARAALRVDLADTIEEEMA